MRACALARARASGWRSSWTSGCMLPIDHRCCSVWVQPTQMGAESAYLLVAMPRTRTRRHATSRPRGALRRECSLAWTDGRMASGRFVIHQGRAPRPPLIAPGGCAACRGSRNETNATLRGTRRSPRTQSAPEVGCDGRAGGRTDGRTDGWMASNAAAQPHNGHCTVGQRQAGGQKHPSVSTPECPHATAPAPLVAPLERSHARREVLYAGGR